MVFLQQTLGLCWYLSLASKVLEDAHQVFDEMFAQ